jgi:hypothetical protein
VETRVISLQERAKVEAKGYLEQLLAEGARNLLQAAIGVPEDGTKELLAVVDGYRESTESWRELLQQLKLAGSDCGWSREKVASCSGTSSRLVLAGGFCCVETGLTDALRSPHIHNFLGLGKS